MIRRMTTDDYEELADMWMKAPNMGLRSLDDSVEGIGRFLKRNPETTLWPGRITGWWRHCVRT